MWYSKGHTYNIDICLGNDALLYPHWDQNHLLTYRQPNFKLFTMLSSELCASQACKKRHLKLYHANSSVSLILQGLFFDFISFNFSVWVGTNVEAGRNYKVCKSHFRVQCTKERQNCFNLSFSTPSSGSSELFVKVYIYFFHDHPSFIWINLMMLFRIRLVHTKQCVPPVLSLCHSNHYPK